jgi:hypothetical protein
MDVMTNRRVPTCFECRHLRLSEDAFPVCAAFPDGIDMRLYIGEFDHLNPLPGDSGIQWEPAEGVVGYPVLRLIRGSM